MISDSFSMALKNLRRRRLRSWLTVIGILISVAIIFILVSLSIGLQAAIQEQFRLLGADKFFVQARGQVGGQGGGGAAELTDSDVEVIRRVSGVKEASPIVIVNAKIEFKDETRYLIAAGLDLETVNLYFEGGSLKIKDGRNLRAGDSKAALAGYNYRYGNLFKNPVGVGDSLTINNVSFKVRGIIDKVGSPDNDRQIYLPLEDVRDVFNVSRRVDSITVQVLEGENVQEVAKRVEKKLRSTRDVDEKTQDFTILTPEELLATVGNILNIITGFLLGVAAISLLVGSIGVATTMYTAVVERTKEIGVMKAVGARNRDILTLFTIEAGLLGVVGGILGVVFGIIIVKAVEFIADSQLGIGFLKAAIPWYLVLGSLLFSFIVGAISGIIPAWKAASIKTIDALRYE